MINLAEASSLPPADVEHLLNIEPKYSVKLSGASFAVTQEAHEFYKFAPIVEVANAAPKRISNRDSRTPFLTTTLVAPTELPDGTEMRLAQYARHEGVCNIWIAHGQSADEYEASALAVAERRMWERFPRAQKHVIDEIVNSPSAREGAKATIRKFHLANILNGLETIALNQVVYMREQSYSATPNRESMLQKDGVLFRGKDLSEKVIMLELFTTRAVTNYARKRAAKLTQQAFNIYFDGDFSPHRVCKFKEGS